MIKAVIFDVGGVLVRTEDRSFRQLWEARLQLQPGEAEEIVFNSDMGQQAQRGQISDEDLWAWIGQYLELGDQLGMFRRDFWAGDVLDEQMADGIRELRKTYQTAIISNATDALRENVSRQLGIGDAFDAIIGSAEEGIMKPDPAIYRRALGILDRQPQEAVFIDDFVSNVEAARQLGMKAIHFRPGLDLWRDLEKLGVVPI